MARPTRSSALNWRISAARCLGNHCSETEYEDGLLSRGADADESRCSATGSSSSTKATPSARLTFSQSRSAATLPSTGIPSTVLCCSSGLRVTIAIGFQSGLGCWASALTVA